MLQGATVLDFGSGRITALVGKRGLNNTIVLSGVGESEYAGFCDGEFVEPEQLLYAITHAIKNAEASSNTTISHLIIGVPGEFTKVECKDASLSLGKKRKILESDIDELHAQGNTFALERDYTLINNQAIYYALEDGRRLIAPAGLASSKISGHVSYVLAENRFIAMVTAILGELNITSFEFMSSLVAESMFLFDDAVRDRFVVFIDVGCITTNVVVARGDGILAQYNISRGGAHISIALAKVLGINYTEAENLKRKIILNLNVSDRDVYTISTKRLERLEVNAKEANEVVAAYIKIFADTITKALKLCDYDYPDYIPYHLTGGGLAYIKGAAELLSKHLKKPVEIIAPNLPQSRRPHLSSSLGLLDMALRLQPIQEETSKKNSGLLKKIFGKK